MQWRHWLYRLAVIGGTFALTGCCHDSLVLRGDWSLGVEASPACGARCTAGGCRGGASHMAGVAGVPTLAAGALDATPHAKFHPVPTQPVFRPKQMIVGRPPLPIEAAPPFAEPEAGEELYLNEPTPADAPPLDETGSVPAPHASQVVPAIHTAEAPTRTRPAPQKPIALKRAGTDGWRARR